MSDDDMDYPPLSPEEQADVNREWEAYWCALLAPNGTLDVERVKREMYAFGMLADDVSKVYMAVTGDKVSKPGTDPDVVIELAKEHSETRLCPKTPPGPCFLGQPTEFVGTRSSRATWLGSCR